jgi:BirA family biotin operon repressor/biotin-[acetyl-CoA-carboxylase] ligase
MDDFFPGARKIYVEQTSSTNSYMLQLSATDRLPEGSVAVTGYQSHGRGQGDHFWESEPRKNLIFSMVLYPASVKGADQFRLSLAVSLAVYDFVSQHVENVSVKWPNDVYVGDKKIAGILIENFIEGNCLNKSITGIGVNINQEIFASNAPNPVSLRQLTGNEYDLNVCLDRLTGCIAARYRMMQASRIRRLHTDYLQHLYRFGQPGRFRAGGRSFEAVITGINRYGMLEMITADREQKTFGFGEVRFE